MYAVPNQYGGKLPGSGWHVKDARSHRRPRRHIALTLLCFTAFLFTAYRALLRPGEDGIAREGETSHETKDVGKQDIQLNADGEKAAQNKTESEEEDTFWKGWSSVEDIFIFGDSYSDTNFVASGEQPSRENPMGNSDSGLETFVKHTRWPVPLTSTYNDSFVKTYNFARSGSVVDHKAIAWDGPMGTDLFDQYGYDFKPAYMEYDMNASNWKPETSLFIIFMGINDNLKIHEGEHDEYTQTRILTRYEEFLQQLYESGARNFLLLSTPPLERYPFGRPEHGATVKSWNANLTRIASTFRDEKAYSTVLEFDTASLISRIIDDPGHWNATAHYKNTTGYCKLYGGEWQANANDIEKDGWHRGCQYPLNDYLFWDALHFTSPAHEVLALEIAETLRGNGPGKGNREKKGWRAPELKRRRKIQEQTYEREIPRIGG